MKTREEIRKILKDAMRSVRCAQETRDWHEVNRMKNVIYAYWPLRFKNIQRMPNLNF